MIVRETRELIARLKQRCEAEGCRVEILDHELTALAHKDGNAIYLVRQYRPERDGYTGSKWISEDFLEEWLSMTKV